MHGAKYQKNNFLGIFLLNRIGCVTPMIKAQDGDVCVYVKETFPASMYHVAVFLIPAGLGVTSSLRTMQWAYWACRNLLFKTGDLVLGTPILMLSPWCALLDLLGSLWVIVLGFLIISNMHNCLCFTEFKLLIFMNFQYYPLIFC